MGGDLSSRVQAGFVRLEEYAPRIRAFKSGAKGEDELWSEEVPYSFIANGTVAGEFEIGCKEYEAQVEEAALVPQEAEMPRERVVSVEEGLKQFTDAESDEEVTGHGE